jgi:hypothetical protein
MRDPVLKAKPLRNYLIQMNALVPAPGALSCQTDRVIKIEESAKLRFLEFFTANIRNRNTRRAYARAVSEFLAWCEDRGTFRPWIDADHDRSSRCSKRERGSAAYPRCGTRTPDQDGSPFKIDLEPFHTNLQK